MYFARAIVEVGVEKIKEEEEKGVIKIEEVVVIEVGAVEIGVCQKHPKDLTSYILAP